jgi:glycerol-3-phosphate acyltransferase PlsY
MKRRVIYVGYLIAAMLAYLLGCSNMALYLSRLKKVNFRDKGSGNLGASNATLLLGWKAGVLVALHDAGKAFLAVLLCRWLFPNLEYVGAVAGIACVLGHIFPFYLKFKGGKGFASYIGMTFALNWKLAMAILIAAVLITVITDYIVFGTLTTIISVPTYLGITCHSLILALILLVGTAVIVLKHRENFVRIAKKTEPGLRCAISGKERVNK